MLGASHCVDSFQDVGWVEGAHSYHSLTSVRCEEKVEVIKSAFEMAVDVGLPHGQQIPEYFSSPSFPLKDK